MAGNVELRSTESLEDRSYDPWNLLAREPAEDVYLANGFMGASVRWDGGLLSASPPSPCYVRGVYSPHGPAGVDYLATVPSWLRLSYAPEAEIRVYERTLDLRHGILNTRMTLQEDRGAIHLEQRVFVSRSDPHLAALQLTVTPQFDGPLSLVAVLDPTDAPDLTVHDMNVAPTSVQLRAEVPEYSIAVAADLSFQCPCWDVSDSREGNILRRTLTAMGNTGMPLQVTEYVRLATSLDPDWREFAGPVEAPDYEAALQSHREAWEHLWQTDIEIDGDGEIQQFARAALFSLWSTMREGDTWSIAPMGLSSNFYLGHIFWDAELWMFPSLLVTHPQLAYPCVAYRERTIDAARQRATSNGYRGAQFPWEGAFTGEEMTPPWAETRDFQLHITADVAIGQWLYYLNTGDVDWMREHGWPVIRECAEFWASRVEYNAAEDRYEVSDVVCADEYAEHVDNDAFTNAAVAEALRVACRAAELAGEQPPPEWLAIADKMHVPYDRERQIHLEFDGYDGRVTKQADVELLAYPLEYTTGADAVARDLDYYGAVIDPDGPAMSFSIYAILSAQLGRADDAYEYLRRSFIPNTRRPFWTFSETPSNDAFYFCTGVGGSLQALLFGFSGIRIRGDRIVVRPILPQQWNALRLRNLFLAGARTDIEIEREQTIVRRMSPAGAVALELRSLPSGETGVAILEGPEGTELAFEGEDTSAIYTPHYRPVPPQGLHVRATRGNEILIAVEYHANHAEHDSARAK